VADFSAELLPSLAEHYEIDAVVSSPVHQDRLPSGVEVVDVSSFEQSADRYDRVLYHVGNSVAHTSVLGLLRDSGHGRPAPIFSWGTLPASTEAGGPV
jgi:hypothetical protein